MRLLAYIRVSTDSQADSGAGLDAQLESCERYAERNGLTIHQVFKDEGISGSGKNKDDLGLESAIGDRPGLMSAINEIKKDDVLLVAKRDRLARDGYAIAVIKRTIESKKARIISAAGEGTDQNDPASKMLTGIVDVFAEYERDMIRARTKAALQAMKREGKRVGHIPFGFKLAQDEVYLEESPEEQDILRQMSELRSQGLSIRDIAKALNERNAFNRGQSKWNHASVHRIMKMAA